MEFVDRTSVSVLQTADRYADSIRASQGAYGINEQSLISQIQIENCRRAQSDTKFKQDLMLSSETMRLKMYSTR